MAKRWKKACLSWYHQFIYEEGPTYFFRCVTVSRCVISCSFEIACHMWQSTCRFHLVPSPKHSRPHPTMKIGLRMADVFSGGFVGDSYDLLYQWVLVSEGDDTWVTCGCTKPCLSSMFVWRYLVVHPPTSKSI